MEDDIHENMILPFVQNHLCLCIAISSRFVVSVYNYKAWLKMLIQNIVLSVV